MKRKQVQFLLWTLCIDERNSKEPNSRKKQTAKKCQKIYLPKMPKKQDMLLGETRRK